MTANTMHPHTTLHIARVVLEAETPLSITSGMPDATFDTTIVRDANGLPALPGSSIAGVLRRLCRRVMPDQENALFGFQRAESSHDEAGHPSRLLISWGAMIDSQGSAVEGLLMGGQAERTSDPLVSRALKLIDEPATRNRVRIGPRGAAENRGKFDRSVLPAGYRFAVEVSMWGEPGERERFEQVLGLLRHPGFRLGGGTRSGLGRMTLRQCHVASIDTHGDPNALSGLGDGLSDVANMQAFSPSIPASGGILTGELTLSAQGLWRVGQGSESLQSANTKVADLLPLTEERVDWEGDHVRPALAMLLLPGSSLKGALAHRAAFHARRLQATWAEDTENLEAFERQAEEKPPAIAALLGEAGDADDSGQAGCLYVDDGFMAIDDAAVSRLMHNSIDRFTGGVRNRMLFEEESLLGGEVSVTVTLDLSRLEASGETQTAREALRESIEDLVNGRLPLGSRTTSGNGYFSGRLEGDLADWLYGDKGHEEKAA